MRAFYVLVADPAGDQPPGVTEVAEQRLVETFIAELAVVGFAEGVLGRLARCVDYCFGLAGADRAAFNAAATVKRVASVW